MAVITARTTAMPTYLAGPGWPWAACPMSPWPGASCPGAAASSAAAVVSSTVMPSLLPSLPGRHEVDDREDHDPDDVDEVPVQAGHLHPEALLGRDQPPHRHPRQGEQPQDAHGHVDAVEA